MTAPADTNAVDAPVTSRQVASGVAWSYSAAAVVFIAQIVYTAVTARILDPAAFGAYASAQALIALMGYFSLAALGNTLTRMTVMTRATVGTALYLAAVAGSVASAATVLLADAWATAWHVPEAAPLIAVWAPAIVLSALGTIPVALLRRRLRYASAAGVEFASPMMGFVVGAMFVFALRSPTALVIGQVANAATLLVVGLIVVRHEIGLRFSKREAWGLFSFSGQVSAQNLAHYGVYTLPGLVIARLAGSAALGFFSRANLLVMLPMGFLTVGISKALYPAIPQVADLGARRRALSDVVAISTFLVWPALGILAGSSGLVVDLLFGPGWGPAAAMIPPLCLFAAANLVYVILASAMESVGWLRVGWMIQASWGGALVLSTLLAWKLDANARMYLYAYAATQIAIHVFQVAVLSRRGFVSSGRVVKHELVGGLMAMFAFVVALAPGMLLEDASLATRFAVTGSATILLAVAVILTLPRVAAGRALAERDLLPAALASRKP